MKVKLLVLVTIAALAAAFAQGPLTPPGAPAPTMKTLDQIDAHIDSATAEKRIDVLTLPGGSVLGNPTLHIIDASLGGSYYLGAGITVRASGQFAIGIINTGSIVLDLNGQTIEGGSLGVHAIFTDDAIITVRNGSVRNFTGGGVIGNARNTRVEDVTVTGSGNAFQLGAQSIAVRCIAKSNNQGFICGLNCSFIQCIADASASYGFFGNGGVFRDCIATGNGGDGFNAIGGTFVNCSAINSHTAQNAGIGFDVGTGCTLTGCRGNGNDSGFIFSAGCTFANCVAESNPYGGFVTHITGGTSDGLGCVFTGCSARGNGSWEYNVGDGSSLTHCTALGVNGTAGIGITATVGCTIADCAVRNAAVYGIVTGARSTVRDCTVTGTSSFLGGYGIVVSGDCVVVGCHSSQNTYGISVSNGSSSRIEGNEVRDNTNTGISAGASDVILRNSAGGNGTNYSPSSGVNFAPIQSLSTMTNPAANIAF